MNDKQFSGYIGLILMSILDVIKDLPDGEPKEKLQKIADNLQKTLDE